MRRLLGVCCGAMLAVCLLTGYVPQTGGLPAETHAVLHARLQTLALAQDARAQWKCEVRVWGGTARGTARSAEGELTAFWRRADGWVLERLTARTVPVREGS